MPERRENAAPANGRAQEGMTTAKQAFSMVWRLALLPPPVVMSENDRFRTMVSMQAGQNGEGRLTHPDDVVRG